MYGVTLLCGNDEAGNGGLSRCVVAKWRGWEIMGAGNPVSMREKTGVLASVTALLKGRGP